MSNEQLNLQICLDGKLRYHLACGGGSVVPLIDRSFYCLNCKKEPWPDQIRVVQEIERPDLDSPFKG